MSGFIEIPTPNGGKLRCHSGEEYMYGSQVSICDAEGNEIITWTADEWKSEPELVMGAIFGFSVKSIPLILSNLGKTKIECGCWI